MFNYGETEKEIHPAVRIEDIADEIAEHFEVSETEFRGGKRWFSRVCLIGQTDERFQIIVEEGNTKINVWIDEGDGLGIGMPCDNMQHAVEYILSNFKYLYQ